MNERRGRKRERCGDKGGERDTETEKSDRDRVTARQKELEDEREVDR